MNFQEKSVVKNRKHIVLCNGAVIPKEIKKATHDRLWHLTDNKGKAIFGTILLEKFVNQVSHLPDRLKDLLELAGNLFIIDRKVERGETDSLEFDGWSRTIHFVMKVRDGSFWMQGKTRELLSEALTFMTGDYKYQFYFQGGYPSKAFNLFDQAGISVGLDESEKQIALFSGGLDSFTGAVDFLETTKGSKLILISHTSGNPSTKATQERIYRLLDTEYPGRTVWYKFKCHMKGARASEESQRTRSMLYSSVAFAISSIFKTDSFIFFENGVTSLNFPKRADMINARSSRTTHPRTIWHLKKFFSHVHNKDFTIQHPYLLMTKTDVIARLKFLNKNKYINSTVSCSVALKKEGNYTHCGTCSQCVDRRFAMHASHLEEDDGVGIYSKNFITDKINDDSDKLIILDHVRQAMKFKDATPDSFYYDMSSELNNLLEYMDIDEEKAFYQIYDLCKKHGQQIHEGILSIRNTYDDPFKEITAGSFLDIVKEKEYLKSDVKLLCKKIGKKLHESLPIMFRSNLPKNENDLNDKINGVINGEAEQYGREFPSIQFASIRTVVDHSFKDLLIEAKYLRGSTGERVVTDGISADLIKYSSASHLLFVLYDPERKISNDKLFMDSFEGRRRNITICIIR